MAATDAQRVWKSKIASFASADDEIGENGTQLNHCCVPVRSPQHHEHDALPHAPGLRQARRRPRHHGARDLRPTPGHEDGLESERHRRSWRQANVRHHELVELYALLAHGRRHLLRRPRGRGPCPRRRHEAAALRGSAGAAGLRCRSFRACPDRDLRGSPPIKPPLRLLGVEYYECRSPWLSGNHKVVEVCNATNPNAPPSRSPAVEYLRRGRPSRDADDGLKDLLVKFIVPSRNLEMHDRANAHFRFPRLLLVPASQQHGTTPRERTSHRVRELRPSRQTYAQILLQRWIEGPNISRREVPAVRNCLKRSSIGWSESLKWSS
mmetsp:Transcript_99439/g.259773  ORF Transcript_99439/g.259773 Transcript_99439/m.259773 type:complete len:323 (-) Transcript_99439:289-1257(-)